MDPNEVPEINAVNRDGGAEDLNADPVSQSLSDSIDHALDAAENATENPDIFPDTSSRYERNVNTQQPDQKQVGDTQFPANFGTNSGTKQEDFDPDLAMPPNMSEKQQSNWRKLSDRYAAVKREAAEAAALRQQLAQLEQRQQQMPPDYEELRRFRQVWDMQNDPTWKAKYDKPISERKERIYELLRKHKAGDDVIKAIEDAGGPAKVPADWWYSNAINRLQKTNGLDAKRLETALMEIDDLEQTRQKDLAGASENQQAWLQEREQEMRATWERDSAEVASYMDNLTKELPWARYQEIPAGATPEQIQRIQAHNAGVQDLEQKYHSAQTASTPIERASVAAAATLSHVLVPQLRYEQQQNAKLQTELARLNKELASIKGAGRMPRNQVAGQMPVGGNLSSRMNMSPMDAIDLGLQEAGI